MAAVSSFTSFSSSHSIAPNSISSNTNKNNNSSLRFRPQSNKISASVCTASVSCVRSSINSPASSLYDVLGIQNSASCQEIKAAYRRLAREVHPDVNGQRSDTSANEFIRVREAYSTLSDPHKRADYDRTLFLGSRFTYASMSNAGFRNMNQSGFKTRPSRATGRSWETDQCW